MIRINGHVKLFLHTKTDLLHLHPVIFGIGINRHVKLLAHSESYLVYLGGAHILLEPFIDRLLIQQRKPYLLKRVVLEASLEIRNKVYGRIQRKPYLSHGFVIIGRIRVNGDIHFILKPHTYLFHLQPIEFRVRI